MNERFPYITDELLDYLKRVYPAPQVDLDMSDRKIWYMAGRYNVIEHLTHVHKAQREAALGEPS